MQKFFLFVIISIGAIGCTTSTNNKAPAIATVVNETKKDSFFPITSFLKGQMITLDSLPVNPLHTITINHKTDSLWLKKKQLVPLLNGFLFPEIKETNLIKYFKETSFNDQTLNAITFTYDPVSLLPDSLTLRHWDIYIDPESGEILKVYLVKKLKEKENIITQQLTWKTNKSASITTLLNKPNGDAQLLKEEKFIWNFNE